MFFTPVDKLTGNNEMELFYYVSNPLLFKTKRNLFSVNIKKNNLITLFDNDFHKSNSLYVCFASDVFEHNKNNNIDISEENFNP